MADFCEQCSKELDMPQNDMKGLTSKEDWENECAALVLCEGCGWIQVDPEGNCVSKDCFRGGHDERNHS